MSRFDNDRDEVKAVINAIRLKCLDCSCWQQDEVEKCWDNICPLYPFRMEGKAVGLARLRELREKTSENQAKVEGFKTP